VKHYRPLIVLGLAFLAAGFVTVAFAQPPTAGTSGAAQPATTAQPARLPYQIAIVDIMTLVKDHPTYVAKANELRAKEQEMITFIQKKQNDWQGKQSQLQAMNPNSPDYAKINDELLRDRLDVEKEVKLKQRELGMENAKCALQAYTHVKQVIDNYAKSRGFALILFNQPLGADAEESVLQGMNPPEMIVGQPIVWHYPQLDITEDVQKQLFALFPGYKPPAAAANPNAPLQR
jgi:Skp family chaperone for outer membrane proteins